MDSPVDDFAADAPYICMSDSRCRLCQFDLQDGDLVIARLYDGRYSSQLALRMHDAVYDSRQHVNFHTCGHGMSCMMSDIWVPFFHTECLRFRHFAVSDRLVAAGEYAFNPPVQEQERRSHRIRRLLVPRLRCLLRDKLPTEILAFIAGLLVRECACIAAEEHALLAGASNGRVELSSDIYASHCTLDGVRYVKSLVNSTSDLRDQGCYVLLHKMGQSIDEINIQVAQDHRGIRIVKWFPSEADPLRKTPPMVGVWWRDISIHDMAYIHVETDGIKLRDILVSSSTSIPTKDFISWSTPEHPAKVMDLTTLAWLDQSPERPRMTSFGCNFEGTTGYTAVTDGLSVAAIHAHRGDSDDGLFYTEMDNFSPDHTFLYMPLDDGEYVTEICRQYDQVNLTSPTICLVFITNRGRSTLFGSILRRQSYHPLDKIYDPAPEGSLIHVNDSNTTPGEESIRYIAFQEPSPPTERPFPPSLKPRMPCYSPQRNESWFVSSCSTGGIEEVTLCRDVSLAHKPVLGILIAYENGHRECLGQFRFDKQLERVRVDKDAGLYVGSSRVAKSCLYVLDVVSGRPTDQGLHWMEVSYEGILEWWLYPRLCLVRHTSARGHFTNQAALMSRD